MRFVTGVMFWRIPCWISDRQEYTYPHLSGFLVLSSACVVRVNNEEFFPCPSYYAYHLEL